MVRILLGSHDELHVVKALRDDVPGRHDQGGWSQANFERSIDEEIKDHIRRSVRELLPLHQAGLFRQLLAAGPEEVRPMFEQYLHSYVKPTFCGWLDLDVENVTPQDVHRVALPVIEQIERREQAEYLERLRAAIATDGRGVAGIKPVLDALNEHRVDTLLIAEDSAQPGVRCRKCGWLGEEDVSECPVDGGELAEEPDIMECAVESALLQSAQVMNVGRDSPSAGAAQKVDILDPKTSEQRACWMELTALGSIAALLRF
jgi:peptide chain release factor subunit 1